MAELPKSPPPGWPQGVSWPPPISPDGRLLMPPDWPGNLNWYQMAQNLTAQAAATGAAQSPAAQPSAPAVGQPGTQPAVTPAAPPVQGGAISVPPGLAAAPVFQRHAGSYVGAGGKITRVSEGRDAAGNPNGTWIVEYQLSDGKSTIAVNYTAGPSGIEASGSSANIQTSQAQEQALRSAQTDLAIAQGENVDEETKSRRMANAQRAANAAAGRGANTDTDIAQINSANAGSAATVANAQSSQANVDLAYVRAMAEILEKRGVAANQAYQMAYNYAVDKAKIDQSNTATVTNAATTLLNNDTTLANARLNAANSGFSSDVQQAMALNEYMPIGSDKAVDVLLALRGLRDATAGKAGAYRNTEPAVLTQLGRNTPVALPGLDYDAVMDHATALQERSGTGQANWPTVPNRPFNGSYVQAPGAHTSSGSAGQAAAGSTPNTFRPITWEAANATPIGQQAIANANNDIQSGAVQVSAIGKGGEVRFRTPDGKIKIFHTSQLPPGFNLIDSANLPDPQDMSVFGEDGAPDPGEAPQSRFEPDANNAVAMAANQQRQNDLLRETAAEEARQRRLRRLMDGENPYDAMADGTYQIPFFA